MFGWIPNMFKSLFGAAGTGTAIKQVAEVFRVNADAADARDADALSAALMQFSNEFRSQDRGKFDRFMDGMNRIPRPAIALGTIALFVYAFFNPLGFQERMVGLAAITTPMWTVIGLVIAFYFGARHQMKGQDFEVSVAEMATQAHVIVNMQKQIRDIKDDGYTGGITDPAVYAGPEPAGETDRTLDSTKVNFAGNPALEALIKAK